MPTAAAAFYGSEQLSVTQSREALNGSTPAVLLLPTAAFSPTDFAHMIIASNSTAYTQYPLLPGQNPNITFQTEPGVDSAALNSSTVVDNAMDQNDDHVPPGLLPIYTRSMAELRGGIVTPIANDPEHPGLVCFSMVDATVAHWL
jgi:hypothetical protein